MNQEHDDFARQHPSLDRALREQIKAPVVDTAFRQQVFARIEAQRHELQRAAAAPDAVRPRLRAQLVLQLLNLGGAALAAVLLIRVASPWIGQSLLSLWMAMAMAVVALLFGLQRARLLDWVRTLDI